MPVLFYDQWRIVPFVFGPVRAVPVHELILIVVETVAGFAPNPAAFARLGFRYVLEVRQKHCCSFNCFFVEL